MRKLDQILEFNKGFVDNKKYVDYATSKNPNKKLLVLSCMDTRLTSLLPEAMNLKNGDAKIIKNAGATITHPFGSMTRSIVVAISEFGVDEIMVVGHHSCGMCRVDVDSVVDNLIEKGISRDVIDTLYNSGINVRKWLHGFDSAEESVNDCVNLIKNHPLVPKNVVVHGLLMSPETGKIDVIVNGYEK
ncbi:beta-class carbonic anhydrase [Metaclostridioides mangenotii]|uniref:beta-class carbonic anhydrase n=1 Tax=Metaclostridioides mangenotii TaxID=1540 RepID=UPI000482BBD3|nr:carbonic anhydrase [Clostridioides mangenotii]